MADLAGPEARAEEPDLSEGNREPWRVCEQGKAWV